MPGRGNRLRNFAHVGIAVGGGHRDTQPAGIGRDGRRHNRRHKHSAVEQAARHAQGRVVRTGDDRDDRRGVVPHLQSTRPEARPQSPVVAPQGGHALGLALDQVDRGHRRGGAGRGQGGGEDERPGDMLEQRRQFGHAGDESAHRGDALRQRTHLDVHSPPQSEVALDAASVISQHAQRMGFVDHQPGAVAPGDLNQRREIDDVAVHAEDGIRDHERARPLGGLGQRAVDGSGVVVRDPDQFGAGEQASVHNAGVVELVADDDVAAADHGRNNGDVGDIPAAVGHRGRCADKRCDPRLEPVVQVGVAGQQAHAMGPGAVVLHRRTRGRFDLRMAQQPEIRVGGSQQDRAAFDGHPGAADGLHRFQVKIEIALLDLADASGKFPHPPGNGVGCEMVGCHGSASRFAGMSLEAFLGAWMPETLAPPRGAWSGPGRPAGIT